VDLDAHLPAIAAGDAVAFGRWLTGVEGRVRLALRSFAGVVDVEAVVQEAFLRTWQLAPRVEPDGRADALLRFCIRIAHNLAIDEARRTRRQHPLDQEALERASAAALGSAGAAPADPFLRAAIAECRERLPPKPAQALSARLESGGAEPDATLALGLGMRLNTFLQNFTRARKLLADCLKARGVELQAEHP
jgi:DNA-directed RNA polymerase specialized sigma24 family protein